MRNAGVRIFSQGTPAKVQSNRNFRFTLRGPYWLSDPLIAYQIDTSMEDYLYLIVPFWYASAAYQASLVEPWFVFWRDVVEPKYPW